MQPRSITSLLSALLVCICTVGTHAQILFESSTEIAGTVSLSEIELLPDGDLIMAGYSGDSLLLVRSTTLGDVVWSRVYPGIGKVSELHLTPSGRVSVYSRDGLLSSITNNFSSIHLFDPVDGNPIQTLPWAAQHSWVTEDSLVYLSVDSFPPYINSYKFGHINGGVAWNTPAPNISSPDYIGTRSLMVTSNGVIVVCGHRYHQGNSVVFDEDRFWLIRYNSVGTFLDSVEYTASATGTRDYRIIRSPDGGFLAYGLVGSAAPLWVRGDQNGEVTSVFDWYTNMDPGTTGIGCVYSMHTAVRQNGTYVCGAMIECGNPFPPRSLLEFDATGLFTCSRVFPNTVIWEAFGDLVIDSEGNTYVVGTPSFTYYPFPANDTWMGIATICEDQVGIDANETKEPFSVYPQPSTGIFTIQLDVTRNNPFTAEVFDAFGTRVTQYRVSSPSFTIDLTNHDPGMYHLRVADVKGKGWSTVLLRVE